MKPTRDQPSEREIETRFEGTGGAAEKHAPVFTKKTNRSIPVPEVDPTFEEHGGLRPPLEELIWPALRILFIVFLLVWAAIRY
jgi:hypothetical protein